MNPVYDYSNKVVLVTGGSRGIGRETCLAFARCGTKVVISARSDDGQETADMIYKEGGDAIFVRSDIAKEADVKKLIQTAIEKYGQLDFAINNAGHSGHNGFIHEQTESNYDTVFDSNVRGTLLCMKHELLAMLNNNDGQGYGRIVNVASSAGFIGLPRIGIYVASKHAMMGLTRTAGLEYATKNIRVNAVVPGTVDKTLNYDIFAENNDEIKKQMVAMHATKKILEPEDVVPAILFLCSDGANLAIGSPLFIDGGLTTGKTWG